MEQIWVAIITAIIAPVVLFVLQTIKERRDGMKQVIRDMRMVTLRLEILFNLFHNPDDETTILNLYDKYHKAGGNSYITKRLEEWSNRKNKREKHEIH